MARVTQFSSARDLAVCLLALPHSLIDDKHYAPFHGAKNPGRWNTGILQFSLRLQHTDSVKLLPFCNYLVP